MSMDGDRQDEEISEAARGLSTVIVFLLGVLLGYLIFG